LHCSEYVHKLSNVKWKSWEVLGVDVGFGFVDDQVQDSEMAAPVIPKHLSLDSEISVGWKACDLVILCSEVLFKLSFDI
jgi:hypothetical protein